MWKRKHYNDAQTTSLNISDVMTTGGKRFKQYNTVFHPGYHDVCVLPAVQSCRPWGVQSGSEAGQCRYGGVYCRCINLPTGHGQSQNAGIHMYMYMNTHRLADQLVSRDLGMFTVYVLLFNIGHIILLMFSTFPDL